MKDPIERQDAIDALADYIHNVDKVIGTGHLSAGDCKDAATSVLEDVPSAQSEADCFKCIFRGSPGFKQFQTKTEERTAELVQNVSDSDLIFRKAAIDALEREKTYCSAFREGYSKTDIFEKYNMGLTDGIKAIKNVPSAQPERTCVNCGRTVNNGGWYADGGTRCPIEEHYALPKDGYCHLWEKRNVTDDDYPERRTDE